MDRWDEWGVFAEVAGRRSFHQAAQHLGRSPQAVTRAVAALEQRLGLRLLHRTTRSVSLTDEGARYLERARPLLAELEALETPAAGELRGRVTVGASVLFGQLHVAPVVHTFLERHAEVEVRLVLHDEVVSLADEGVDVAVRLGALPDSALRARLLGDVRSCLCASPAYLARRGTPRRLEQLSGHDVVAFRSTTPIADRWTFEGGPRGRSRTVSVRPRLTVNTGQAAIDAAVAGLGIARLLSYQVAALLAHGQLREVLPDAHSRAVPVHLVHLPGLATRATSAFVELASPLLQERLSPLRRRSRAPAR